MQKTFALILLLFIAACGVKPGSVEPPEGKGSSTYPHQYPDVKTDPTPYIVRQQSK